jgi:dTDP-4-amino-4,6-dideoxygalactose transaminase
MTPISVDTYSGREFAQAVYESYSVTESQRPALEKELNSYFPDVSAKNEKALCTLSVRSCLDLYFQARQYPRESEILMTGMNIPDMVKIITEHGCVPIPIEISLSTLMPNVEDIKRCITPRTKAIVVAYVYGVTYDCSYIAEALEGTGIEIIEDCAQSFRSVYAFRGSKHAVMSHFSFGTIKYNMCGTGAVTIFRQNAEK